MSIFLRKDQSRANIGTPVANGPNSRFRTFFRQHFNKHHDPLQTFWRLGLAITLLQFSLKAQDTTSISTPLPQNNTNISAPLLRVETNKPCVVSFPARENWQYNLELTVLDGSTGMVFFTPNSGQQPLETFLYGVRTAFGAQRAFLSNSMGGLLRLNLQDYRFWFLNRNSRRVETPNGVGADANMLLNSNGVVLPYVNAGHYWFSDGKNGWSATPGLLIKANIWDNKVPVLIGAGVQFSGFQQPVYRIGVSIQIK